MNSTGQINREEGKLEELAGEIIRIRHCTATWFCAEVYDGKKNQVVSGPSTIVPPIGSTVILTGNIVADERFGPQFKFKAIAIEPPKGRDGAIAFLETLDNVSKIRARMIVSALGDNSLDVICQDPTCLTRIPGFGDKLAKSIGGQLIAKQTTMRCEVTLVDMRLATNIRRRVIEFFGNRLNQVIQENPYELVVVEGVSFNKIDSWCIRTNRMAPDSIERGAAVIVQALKVQAESGHTYQDRGTILEGAKKLQLAVPFPLSKLQDSLTFAIGKDMILNRREGFGLRRLILAEERIHQVIADWLDNPSELGSITYVPESIIGILTDEQRSAIQNAIGNRISILTGGPGTGKTLTSKGILAAYPRTGVMVVAPTGKAAKRAHEVTGLEAMTIHRFIAIISRQLVDPNDHKSPDEIIPQVVLIDEASMVDVELMSQLLHLLNQRTAARLVIVGDVDQLPSVGPGQLLFDMICCGKIPMVRLSKVMRQQGDSNQIVDNAYLINSGQMPDNTKRPARQWLFGESNEAEKIQSWVKSFLGSRCGEMGFDPIKDVQVLTGQRKGDLGCEGLNILIRECLNPPSSRKAEVTTLIDRKRVVLFREGDKVMNIENNQDLGVVNGDQGIVSKITFVQGKPDMTTVEVLLDSGETITYHNNELTSLVQAWAITVHKSQGSEYPVVVMICHQSLSWALQRSLLYTGVTRAKKHLVLFGSSEAIRKAVLKEREPRMTRLAALFNEVAA